MYVIFMDMYTLQYSYTLEMSIIVQVTMPAKITPRQGHSAVVFGVGQYKVVVLFGGLNSGYDYISETTFYYCVSDSKR